MTILSEMQTDGLIKFGCFLKGGEVGLSSFPAEYKKHLSVARQSLVYIFNSLEKRLQGYDEVHMEVGRTHFSGYLLSPDTILVCLCESSASQQQLREFVSSNQQRLLGYQQA